MPSPFTWNDQVILDGSGYGALRFSLPGFPCEVTRLTVRASSYVQEAQVNIYRNIIGPAYLEDGTPSGSSGDTTDTVFQLADGEALIIEWVGGDPGAVATYTLSGTRTVDKNGFRV